MSGGVAVGAVGAGGAVGGGGGREFAEIQEAAFGCRRESPWRKAAAAAVIQSMTCQRVPAAGPG